MLKPTIICVDDEQLILIAIKEQLQINLNNEFYIETAESGEEALEIIEELRNESSDIPVIISDYLMPSMKGDKFLIKAHEIIPETRKILLTGQARIEGVTNAVNNADLYRFIEKPWNQDDLILTVKEAVKSYFQSKKIFEYNKQLEEMNADLEDKVRIRTKELREANATKDKFLSIIAHDLKNPFTAIYGYSSMLKEDFDDFEREEIYKLINTIDEAAGNTLNLLNTLLEWARSQQGIIEVNKETYNLLPLVTEAVGAYKAAANNKNISIEINIPQDFTVYCDYYMINTVIRNIVSNSIKFTNPGGKIEIESKKTKTCSEIIIKDNGVGMDEAISSGLFKIDKNVSRKGTNDETGTGLGLILCKEFVLKNGGRIWAESEISAGTKTTISLPLKELFIAG
ncbi:MAG: response regulator [Ignavibacteria bacterium]|nr:response regulator [Ignavibacteria bacterium]